MTAANWRAHPYAPWAFANPARFLPTVRLRGLTREPLPLGDPLILEGLGDVDDQFLRETHTDGFIVLHRGRVVYEHYAGATFATSRHLCFSITKSIVGLLAELLIAQRRIAPSDRAGELVPGLTGGAFAGAALRDLLDMCDGVAFDENYGDPDAQIHRYSRHFWGAAEGGVLAGLQQIPSGSAPGAGFAYRTPVMDVVGLVLEAATGRSLPDLVEAMIWQPLGMADEARWVLDTGGRAIASAGFSCTLRDLARLGLALGDAMSGAGDFAPAVASIAGGGDREAFAAAAIVTRPGYSYRSGWWVDHHGRSLNALGVFGQRLHIAQDGEVIIARFGSHPVASSESTDVVHARAFAAIATALGDG